MLKASDEGSAGRDDSTEPQPRCDSWFITIITTDVALFYKSREPEEHVAGITKFVKSLHDEKHCSLRVQLVVMATGAVSVDNPAKQTNIAEDNNHSCRVEEGRHLFNSSVGNCVQELQRTLVTLLQQEERSNTEISIEIIDQCQLGLQTLWAPWLDIRFANTKSSTASKSSILWELDLPETWDCVQSKICLQLKSHVAPSMLTTGVPVMLSPLLPHSKNNDASITSLLSPLKPIQLAPIESLDASLLYGLPMTVTAGVNKERHGSEQQVEDMKVLVQSMFHVLHERGQAIVLKGERPLGKHSVVTRDEKAQIYVIMPRASSGSLSSATSGILFHYASGPDLIDVPTPKLVEGDHKQVVEHVQQALDCLPCLPINPFLVEG